jgi:molybdenum cofactor cytidylyltransferase
MNQALPAIVAAAGLSTRMGASKPLLDAGGRSFLARILSSFREGGADPILVVVRDPDGEEAAAAAAEGGWGVWNPDPAPGPISSLQAGIRALPETAPGVFFSPADHPLFLADTVRTLARVFSAEAPPILAPTYQKRRGHPVIFHRSLFPELLEDGLSQGARSVIQRYRTRRLEVPVDDPGILVDIDTPSDYRRHFP